MVELEVSYVLEVNWFVDSIDSIDEVRSVSEAELVLNVDGCDEIESLFTVVADAVDNLLVCSIEENV